MDTRKCEIFLSETSGRRASTFTVRVEVDGEVVVRASRLDRLSALTWLAAFVVAHPGGGVNWIKDGDMVYNLQVRLPLC